MRRLPFILLPAALALAACSKPEPMPDPIRAVKTMTVAPVTVGGTVEYAGEVRARTESRLGFRVGGKIVRRNADLGDKVRPGQTLAQLDPQDLRLGQEAAQAGLSAAQANLDQAEADFKRFKELRDQGFISSAELERRETAVKAARAQIDQARAQARTQGNQANYSVLTADAAGVVTAIEAEPGMVVAAGTPVLRLAHDGPRDIAFSVPEDRVELVKAAAAKNGGFKVRLWGDGAQALPATIREIAAAADPVTRTFLVKADLGAQGSSMVRLGQTATVLVEAPKVAAVTKLPLSALKAEGGKTIVWVLDKATMQVAAQPVQLAGADGNEAVVAGGLQPGQVVVTAGVHVLTPGQKVKLWVDRNAATASAK